MSDIFDILDSRIAKRDKEMTKDEALKLALEALEEPREHIAKHCRLEAITAIKEALAEPEQEPVAWYDKHGIITHDPFEGVIPLYTAPPKREWIGLTDDEIIQAYCSVGGTAEWAIGGMADVGNFYLAIEAKLKEKNG